MQGLLLPSLSVRLTRAGRRCVHRRTSGSCGRSLAARVWDNRRARREVDDDDSRPAHRGKRPETERQERAVSDGLGPSSPASPGRCEEEGRADHDNEEVLHVRDGRPRLELIEKVDCPLLVRSQLRGGGGDVEDAEGGRGGRRGSRGEAGLRGRI